MFTPGKLLPQMDKTKQFLQVCRNFWPKVRNRKAVSTKIWKRMCKYEDEQYVNFEKTVPKLKTRNMQATNTLISIILGHCSRPRVLHLSRLNSINFQDFLVSSCGMLILMVDRDSQTQEDPHALPFVVAARWESRGSEMKSEKTWM